MPEGRPPSCTQDRGVGLLEQGLDIDNDGGLVQRAINLEQDGVPLLQPEDC